MNDIQFLVIPVLLIAAGFILCFYGNALFKPLLAFIGFIAGVFLAQTIFPGIIENKAALLIVMFSIGILFALLTGFVYSIGVFLAGFAAVYLFLDCCGISLGAQNWNIVIKLIICVGGGIVAYFLQNVVISIIFAFLGSYLIVLNACWIFDFFKYHNKDYLATFSQYYDFFSKTVINSGNSFILIIMAVLTILGILKQRKIIGRK